MLRAGASNWKDRMKGQLRASRNAGSALLPVATAVLAAGIFVVDAITAEKLTVSVLFVVVVLVAARFSNARGVVLVGAACLALVSRASCTTRWARILPGYHSC